MLIYCQTSGLLGTNNVIVQPTWILGKKLAKQIGGSINLTRCFDAFFKLLESQWIQMSDSEIRINLPFKKFGFYALCIFPFLLWEREGNGQATGSPFHTKPFLITWEDFFPSRGFNLHVIWLASMLSSSQLDAENWAPHTLSTRANLSSSHCWQSSKLLFCGSWGGYNWLSVSWWTQ